MEAAYREYKDQGMEVFAVNMKEDLDTVVEYAEEEGFTFIIGLDGDGQIATNYLVFKTPETFFIDKEGVIRQRTIGPLDKETIISKFQQTMKAAGSDDEG